MQCKSGGSPGADAGKDSRSVDSSSDSEAIESTNISEARLSLRNSFHNPSHDIELPDGTHSAPSESPSEDEVDQLRTPSASEEATEYLMGKRASCS